MAGVCKIVSASEWDETLGRGEPYRAVAEADLRDGYLHCVASDQVASTLAMWYTDVDECLIIAIDEGSLKSELEWEPGAKRPGQLFPHIYGEINPEAVAEVHRVSRGSDGTFSLPDGLS